MTQRLEKAKLLELKQDFSGEKPDGVTTDVQFNPETLKITYANQLAQAQGGDQSSGTPGRQFVGSGTTKLALQLWFDVTAHEDESIDDVRKLTQKVVHFMTPQRSDQDAARLAPPGVRFAWGAFTFDGLVENLEQTLEFFSPDGKPLRASVSLALSQQKILEATFNDGKVPSRPGQVPLSKAMAGNTVQSLASAGGKTDWQAVASANGIEDPLRLAAGRLVNLSATVSGPRING